MPRKQQLTQVQDEHLIQRVLLGAESCFPSISVILQQYAPHFANMQLCWIKQLLQTKQLPPCLMFTVSKSLKWLKERKCNPRRGTPLKALRAKMIQCHQKYLQSILDDFTYTPVDLSSVSKSFENICDLFTAVRGQRVVVQIQELFLLLCCKIMSTEQTYTHLLDQLGLNPRCAKEAERFIASLIRQPPETVSSYIQLLSARFKTSIPARSFVYLTKFINNGTFSMSQLLEYDGQFL